MRKTVVITTNVITERKKKKNKNEKNYFNSKQFPQQMQCPPNAQTGSGCRGEERV